MRRLVVPLRRAATGGRSTLSLTETLRRTEPAGLGKRAEREPPRPSHARTCVIYFMFSLSLSIYLYVYICAYVCVRLSLSLSLGDSWSLGRVLKCGGERRDTTIGNLYLNLRPTTVRGRSTHCRILHKAETNTTISLESGSLGDGTPIHTPLQLLTGRRCGPHVQRLRLHYRF